MDSLIPKQTRTSRLQPNSICYLTECQGLHMFVHIWGSGNKQRSIIEIINGLSRPKETLFLPSATKLRQGNIFTPVCHSVPWADTPPRQTPTSRADTPLGRHPPPQTHPHQADGYFSGRYASYWNAFFLLQNTMNRNCMEDKIQLYFIGLAVGLHG